MTRLALIPGDGIGLEAMESARQVLSAVEDRYGATFETTELDWSCERYDRTGSMMPDDGLEILGRHDAILLGAVGRPGVPDHVSLWGLLIPIRRAFEQYVNLRPMRVFESVPAPVRGAAGTDLVIVRENSEGEYGEVGGRLGKGASEVALQQATFSRVGVERIAEYAMALAETRRGQVRSATKSNGIVHTMTFWDEVVDQVAARHPGVTLHREHVDAMAARIVLHPTDFDVVVASNLFGDILSDLAAAVCGSIGIAPSANLAPDGPGPSMFEPVHGSAPDIAGKGLANPVGMLWSVVLMLEHLHQPKPAAALMTAIEESLRDPKTRTADLGGTASTTDVTAFVTERIGQ
ncbi:isocitrate/isopropylmalate dehydrogenase family protein [Kribbella sp. NPDC059898]|uniref:isocitrate/isopropylmalate dehydrogenase family protein n=1 Tax=Kribbella sp. NPDC059898 TaxID=3346995 RepID=UPI00365B9DB3